MIVARDDDIEWLRTGTTHQRGDTGLWQFLFPVSLLRVSQATVHKHSSFSQRRTRFEQSEPEEGSGGFSPQERENTQAKANPIIIGPNEWHTKAFMPSEPKGIWKHDTRLRVVYAFSRVCGHKTTA